MQTDTEKRMSVGCVFARVIIYFTRRFVYRLFALALPPPLLVLLLLLLYCNRHCRCRQLLSIVRCSSHPLTVFIVVVARINYFIVIFFYISACSCSYTYIHTYICCYRFVLICLVEATHAQNFYHSLQEWIEGAPLCARKHTIVSEYQK